MPFKILLNKIVIGRRVAISGFKMHIIQGWQYYPAGVFPGWENTGWAIMLFLAQVGNNGQ